MLQVIWAINSKQTKKNITKQSKIKIFTTWTWKKGVLHVHTVKVWEHLQLNLQEPVKTPQVQTISMETGVIQCMMRSGTADPNSPAAAALHANRFAYSKRPTVVCSRSWSQILHIHHFWFSLRKLYRQKHPDEAEGKRGNELTSRDLPTLRNMETS